MAMFILMTEILRPKRQGLTPFVKFEHEDPVRWSLKKISRDISAYAESIKPLMLR
jgi:hypothetical protein